MALTSDQKLEAVWEWFNNNANTSIGKKFYEETIARTSEVHASDVFSEPVPAAPPAASTSVIKKWYPAAEGGDGWIHLTVDRSVGGNTTWVALPAHNDNWSSGSADTSQVMKGFVSPRYGKQYLVKAFDGNDNEIPQLDPSDWTFDYSGGVLVFNGVSSRAESGNTPADSIKIKVYQYVGETLATAMPNTNGGATMSRAAMSGAVDGANKDFLLPEDVNTDLLYLPKFNGQDIYPGADYTVDGANPRLLHLVASPDPGDRMDVVYYPIS